MNRLTDRGFTLIELMIVVAIMGILASIALPAYQDYTIRAQVVEAFSLTEEIKPSIRDYYKHHGSFPTDNRRAGVPEKKYLIGNYVAGMEVRDGAIHVEFGHKVNSHIKGKFLSLRPQFIKESPMSPISWLCGNDTPVPGMTAAGDNRTDLRDMYLPSACRSRE